jgi:molecular chaperone DnaK
VLKGDDKDKIEKKPRRWPRPRRRSPQQAYAQAGGPRAARVRAQPEAGAGAAGGNDDVVDAEFEEVKDKGTQGLLTARSPTSPGCVQQ